MRARHCHEKYNLTSLCLFSMKGESKAFEQYSKYVQPNTQPLTSKAHKERIQGEFTKYLQDFNLQSDDVEGVLKVSHLLQRLQCLSASCIHSHIMFVNHSFRKKPMLIVKF